MKQAIIKILEKALKEQKIKLKKEEIENLLETPPSHEMGDYAFPCFTIAQKLKQNPKQIALEIRKKIEITKDFEDIQTFGPYINFFINRRILAKDLIKGILTKKDNFGKLKVSEKKVMIEFSQANTHKAFHIGHVRGTSLGESLARILEFCGDKVIRANYQGDTGMHIAKWIWCYQKYHSKEKLKKDESWIASIYVDAVKRLKRNPKLQEQVDEINKVLEEKSDKKLNELWKKTRKLSLDSFEKIYSELNTHFDIYFFEGDLEKRAKQISEELLKKKIAKKSKGATIIDLKKYNLGVWVLLRTDGTVLYSAKDLALAEKKLKELKINNNIYVVGAAQALHISQLFKTLELMGVKDIQNFKFVSFSEVRLPTGKMSSRTGENILYSDFLKEMIAYAKKSIKKKFAKSSNLEIKALKISIAAIKYSMLKQNSNRGIIFNKDEALNFEGDTGPYLQYSYARAGSILKKAKTKLKPFAIKELEPKEIELVKKLSQFQEVVLNSYVALNPSLIANYSYQLAQVFNEFYHACPVIKSEKKLFRLSLVESFRQVIKISLNLLGIDVVEEM